ncbi:hypothetical protein [Parasphingorhabdus sp.]
METHTLSSNGKVEWESGAPTGPLYQEGVIEGCMESIGLGNQNSELVQYDENSLANSKKHIVYMWAMMMGDRENVLRADGLEQVVDYASCVENGLRLEPSFLSGEVQKVQNAIGVAVSNCDDHLLAKVVSNPSPSSEDYAGQEYRLAGIALTLSQVNIQFILDQLDRTPTEWKRKVPTKSNGSLPVVAPPPQVVAPPSN